MFFSGRLLSVFAACVLSVVAMAAWSPTRPDLSSEVVVVESHDDQIEVKEATTSFHRAVIQAATKAVRDGKMRRADLIRLRVAMLSPSFREHAENLAVVQMSASGSDNVPLGDDGRIDRSRIDWEALAAFLEKLLPLILMLIDALSQQDYDRAVFVAMEIQSIRFMVA